LESELKSPESVSRFKGWRASLLLMFNPFDTKVLRFVELAFDIRFTLSLQAAKMSGVPTVRDKLIGWGRVCRAS
jgi:hypothetical protein